MGGDDAAFAIAAVPLNRCWLGWYNSLESFHIAKRLDSFAKSAFVHNLSGSIYVDPMTSFQSDGRRGPRFRAVHSGAVIEETGSLTTLSMEECADWDPERKVVCGRGMQPVRFTIADLGPAPDSEILPTCRNAFTLLFSSIPIVVSIVACALGVIWEDWYALSSILLGIIANGISCPVLGSVDLVFTRPKPAKESHSSDGILFSDKDIILLRGTADAINTIVRGRFSLRSLSEGHYDLVQSCSVLFFIQCFTQLLLIPQASLLGNIMFLTSLDVSAVYSTMFGSRRRTG